MRFQNTYGFLILMLLCCSHVAMAAQIPFLQSLSAGNVHKFSFQSVSDNLKSSDLAKGRFQYDSIIDAHLLMPDKAISSPVPAMIIMHSSGGLKEREYRWGQLFNRMNMAVLIIDSFTGRGVTNTNSSSQAVSSVSMTGDAFVALKLLTTHPQIDANRIGIIGFSRGGAVAMSSTLEDFRKSIIGDDTKFALHIPFYGGCTRISENISDAPVRMFIGDQDSWENIGTCEHIINAYVESGVDAQLTVYPNVYHSFDYLDYPVKDSTGYSVKPCQYLFNLDNYTYTIMSTGETRPSSGLSDYLKTCATTAVQHAGNTEAWTDSKNKIIAFVTDVFHLDGITNLTDEQRTFNFAEAFYREQFWGRSVTQTYNGYHYRCYSSLGHCIGIKNGTAYLYDGNNILPVGNFDDYLNLAKSYGF